MTEPKVISKHDMIKAEILTACRHLGYEAIQECGGRDWRADVLAITDAGEKIAFEVQMSPQSITKTIERQNKYIRDKITGCWLFNEAAQIKTKGVKNHHEENPWNERPDLPLFYVMNNEPPFSVSLRGRRVLPLHDFLEVFLQGKIRFSQIARTKPDQNIKMVFFEMRCWKCGEMNHIYYIEPDFYTACNATIFASETMWGSDDDKYRPEIIDMAREFTKTEEGRHIRLGEIKKRYSRAVNGSYKSFGCIECDSIFGDWFVMETQLEAQYDEGLTTIERTIKFSDIIELEIPHWCYPGDLPYCDE